MSRVGNQPISLPKGVEAQVTGRTVSCKGPKGHLQVELVDGLDVVVESAALVVSRSSEEKFVRAMHGTTRANLQNIVQGVSEGFTKKLEIIGVGYRAQLQGKKLVLNIGFCHPVEIDAPEGITFTCPDNTHIEVTGVNKQQVGQVAANIRAVRKPEPYKGKGIRYEGEYVRRKAGKQGK